MTRTSRFDLAAGDSFTLERRRLRRAARPAPASVTLAVGPLARFDAPGLLEALNRYPYGCTEQVTSQAMPLLYFDEVARAMGLGSRDDLHKRDRARRSTAVLTNQAANGAFGLWRPDSGDFWLDAYVTDFLSRARAQGFDGARSGLPRGDGQPAQPGELRPRFRQRRRGLSPMR